MGHSPHTGKEFGRATSIVIDGLDGMLLTNTTLLFLSAGEAVNSTAGGWSGDRKHVEQDCNQTGRHENLNVALCRYPECLVEIL